MTNTLSALIIGGHFGRWRSRPRNYLGRVANPRPVATIKTGRLRVRLWLVARRDRSWLWRPVLDLQHAAGEYRIPTGNPRYWTFVVF